MASANESINYYLKKIEEGVYKVIDGELYNKSGKQLGSVYKNGYKVYANSHYRVYAHRLLYAFYHGVNRLDQFESINHINGDKLDNHKENLEGCSLRENSIHQWKNGMAVRGEECTYSKLTESDVKLIKQMLIAGEKSQYEIARIFNVSRSAILNIKQGNTWKHVS